MQQINALMGCLLALAEWPTYISEQTGKIKMSNAARIMTMPPISQLRRERMHALIENALSPVSLSIQDDSQKHAGHAGARAEGETHYKIEVVSDQFLGKSRVERHRMVYNALAHEFTGGLHALAIKAMTVEEL